MSLTLAEILKLEVFRPAECEVVAGGAHLGRKVRWVHIAELTDIAYLLEGGELLLTTGMGLGDDPQLLRRYIRELAEAGVAGLVVELGRTFGRLPPAMVEEAERCELPLVALHRETRFVQVTEQVHSAIISRQFELLQKAEVIGKDFTRLVLRGVALTHILHRLAEIVEDPVVLEDEAHQVIDFAVYASPVSDTLHAWEVHSRTGHIEREWGVVHVNDAESRCAWIPIWLRDHLWGRLHVLELDSPFDEIDYLALDRAAAAVGMALLTEQDAASLSDHARSALLSDILQQRYGASEQVFQRARSLGAELEGRQLAALAVQPPDLVRIAAQRGWSEQDTQQIRNTLLAEARQAIAEAGCAGLCALEADSILAVVGMEPDRPTRAALDEVGAEICLRISKQLDDLPVIVGASMASDPESMPRAFDAAKEAMRYGPRVGRGAGVHHFEDLGVHRLLLRLSEGPELARFVESELEPLLKHDAAGPSPLLPTLLAYLDHGGRKSPASRALKIERRTLYHRLERLKRILGLDLDDQQVRTRLTIALQGLELLNRRSAILR